LAEAEDLAETALGETAEVHDLASDLFDGHVGDINGPPIMEQAETVCITCFLSYLFGVGIRASCAKTEMLGPCPAESDQSVRIDHEANDVLLW
jgi:hypothetical protein